MGNSGNKVDTGSFMEESSAELMPQAFENAKGSVVLKESERARMISAAVTAVSPASDSIRI